MGYPVVHAALSYESFGVAYGIASETDLKVVKANL